MPLHILTVPQVFLVSGNCCRESGFDSFLGLLWHLKVCCLLFIRVLSGWLLPGKHLSGQKVVMMTEIMRYDMDGKCNCISQFCIAL